MTGRKPTTSHMRILSGNPGKRPIRREVAVPDITTTPPEHLDEAAKAEWTRMVGMLGGKVLKDTDRAALAMYCQAYGRWVEAEKQVRENGTVVKAPSGYPIQNPFLAIANKAMDQMMKIAPALGLTPVDRTRINVPEAQADPYEEFRRAKNAG